MPTSNPRVQVTIDPELAEALRDVAPETPKSRSRLIRDLALRGAREEQAEQRRLDEAYAHLERIDSGEDDRYDFEVARQMYEAR